MSKLVKGVGVSDVNTGHTVNGKWYHFKSYRCWASMINRCYSDKYQSKKPTYIGCSVAKEWLAYSEFKAFYDKNYVDGWVLDKDLLLKGNKVYSSETCVFVPSYLNTLFIDCRSKRGSLPVGVSFYKNNNKYVAQCNAYGKCHNLGYFSTPELASDAYQDFKKRYVVAMLIVYRGLYPDNAPLMNLLNAMEARNDY